MSENWEAACGVGLLVVSLLMQAVTLLLFHRQRTREDRLGAAVLLVLNLNLAMQVTLPSIVSFMKDFEFEGTVAIHTPELLWTVLLHAIYVASFLGAFMLRRSPVAVRGEMSIRQEPRVLVPFVILGAYIVVTNFSVISSIPSRDASAFEVVNIYLQTMFEYTSIVAAVLLIVFYRGRWRVAVNGAAVAMCLGVVARLLAMGLRGSAFIFLVLGLLFLFVKNGRVNVKYGAALVLVVFPFFSYLGGDYRELLVGSLQDSDTVERLRFMAQYGPGSRVASQEDVIGRNLNAIYTRLEASRNSVSLVKLQDRGQGASLVPTLASLVAVIPARFWSTRPFFPASTTDDVFGSAMYVVKRETYGAADMGPYLASAHEYWEGGILYLLLGGALLGVLWRRAVVWTEASGCSAMSLLTLGLLLDAHHGELSVTAPIALVIRMGWYQYIPTLFVVLLLRVLVRARIGGTATGVGAAVASWRS
jgi:hypothetical protein